MPLDVTIWPKGGGEPLVFDNDVADADYVAIDYLSFVTDNTYGKPPVITADKNEAEATARKGDDVLFVNPANVSALVVHKR